MKHEFSYLDEFSQSAARDVLVQVEYLSAPLTPAPEKGAPGRMAVLREKLPAHLEAMAALDTIYASAPDEVEHRRLIEETRRQFWEDVFGHSTLKQQQFTHEFVDSVPMEIVRELSTSWREAREDLLEKHGPQAMNKILEQEDKAIKKILASVAGDKPGMLQMNFLDAMTAGQEPEAVIDKNVPFPRANKFLKHFLALDAVVVSARLTHSPTWEKAANDIDNTFVVNLK